MNWLKGNWFKLTITILAASAIASVVFRLVSWSKGPESLLVPDVRGIAERVGSSLKADGKAYPGADVNFYVDGIFLDSTRVNANGTFNTTLQLENEKEGGHKLKVNQSFKEVRSDYSGELGFELDLTPPSQGLKVESLTVNKGKTSLYLLVKASDAEYIYINSTQYEFSDDGTIEKNLPLTEGSNNFAFALGDDVGNRTSVLETREIKVDQTPPRIKTAFCSEGSLGSLLEPKDLSPTEEFVCVDTGDWRGRGSSASIPIEGYVRGELGSVTVDGKRIYYDENHEIFQRITLYTPYGLNKYKVVATDLDGNSSSVLLEMTVVDPDKNYQEDVMDRLDDIESRLE